MDKIILLLMALIVIRCSSNEDSTQRKKVGKYFVEAKFVDDSVIDGKAKYFRENKILDATITFSNGIKNGEAVNYFSNGKVRDSVMYYFGLKEGFHVVYDQNGQMKYKDFYYKDHALGPQYYFINDTLERFIFNDFEMREIFSCVYDSGHIINNTRGEILNVSNYDVIFDNVHKYGIFIYAIQPPGTNIKYAIGLIDKDQKKKNELFSLDTRKIFLDTVLNKPPAGWDYYVSADYKSIENDEKKIYITILKFSSNEK
jgi:hypothetical protein